MSRTRIERWTCDSCATFTDVDVPGAPTGWACVAVNDKAPDASWSHDAWRRYQLCEGCLVVLQNGNYKLRNLRTLAYEPDGLQP